MKDTDSTNTASTYVSFNISEATNARFSVIKLDDDDAIIRLEVVQSSYKGYDMITFASQNISLNLSTEQVKALRLELTEYLMRVQFPNMPDEVFEPTINDLAKNHEENLANEGV